MIWYNNAMDRGITTMPAIVQMTARTHVSLLETALPGLLLCYCVVGSAALVAFREGFSDMDFVAVVNRSLSPAELDRLKAVHKNLMKRRLIAPLDGVYVPLDAFAHQEACSPRFNEGRFQGLVRFDPHSPDAWVLKRRGVCVAGPEPERLPYEPDWERVRQWMLQNLNSYWRKWVDGRRRLLSPKAIGLCLLQDALEWGVLGVSRIWFSLRENDITGKEEAGEYALSTVPERWRPVLMEALRRRRPGIPAQYRSPLRRWSDALAYMEFIIGACNNVYRNE